MEKIKNIARALFIKPVVDILIRLNVHPTAITIASLGFALLSALAYWRGSFIAGALLLLVCGVCDSLDGDIARRTNRVTTLGSFLDSTVDRINEFIIYCGLFCYYYTKTPKEHHVLFWIFLALFGSMMVSYTRARGEGLGISPRVGIFERFTRFVLLFIGSILGPDVVPYVLVILSLGTIHTTLQRIIYMHKASQKH